MNFSKSHAEVKDLPFVVISSLTGSSYKAFPQIYDGLAHLRQIVNMRRWFPPMSDTIISWKAFWGTWSL